MTDHLFSIAATVDRAVGQPTASQLTAILKRLPDPSLDPARLYCWTARIAGDGLRDDGLKLTSKARDSLARDCRAGVSLMAGPNLRELPLGATFSGAHTGGTVTAELFTIRGVKTGSVDTDSFIDAIRAGILQRVQLAFSDVSLKCSICDLDPLDRAGSNCLHVPGLMYSGKTNFRPVKEGGSRCHFDVTYCALSAIVASPSAPDPAAQLVARHAASGALRGAELVTIRTAVAARRAPERPASIASEVDAVLVAAYPRVDLGSYLTGTSARSIQRSWMRDDEEQEVEPCTIR